MNCLKDPLCTLLVQFCPSVTMSHCSRESKIVPEFSYMLHIQCSYFPGESVNLLISIQLASEEPSQVPHDNKPCEYAGQACQEAC